MTFNEGSRLDPSRVQRRGGGRLGGGGRPGTGMAVGGGLGSIIIVILALIFGIDPNQLGLNTDAAQGPVSTREDSKTQSDFEARCVTGDSANEYADCRVVGAVNSLDEYWKDALPVIGVQLQLPGMVVFDEATQSGCGAASSQTGPFYCPNDQTIYVDTTFYNILQQQFNAEGGPLAEMYVVAHEYGHHIENQLGIFEIADRSATGPESDSVKVELMADCLAGVWAGHAANEPDASGVPFLKPFTQDDLKQALNAAAAVGDDNIQETVQGYVEPHKFTHGSSAQREAAFVAGYNSGDIQTCDTDEYFNVIP